MSNGAPDLPADLAAFYLGPIHLNSILAVGPAPWPQLESVCEARRLMREFISIDDPLPTSTRYDLAVVYGFDHIDMDPARQVFGHLKNELCQRIWAITSPHSRWQLTEFVALGFRRDSLPDEFAAADSYSYNLESYNHKRDWNNPRFWANPQNWHLRF